MMSKQASSPYHFPEGVLVEIFYRLPAKSLGKCMCVSKAWNFLIKDPFFISGHVNHPSNNLFFVMTGANRPVEYSLHFDDREFSKYGQLQLIPFDNHRYMNIIGSCNGLLCFMYFKFSCDISFVLCNPVIRKSITLPKPCFSDLPYKISVGFGYDSMKNDYKLLKITKKNVLDGFLEVELYSLKKNSWKILAPQKYDLHSDGGFMVFANGILHWVAYERVNYEGAYYRFKFLILGFDLRDDVFKEIMLPECLSNLPSLRQSEMYVIPYDESQSIAVVELGPLRNECNVWVMKEYGVVETWTKMLSFGKPPIDPMFPRALRLRKNGDLILLSSDGLRLVSCDPERNEINYSGVGTYVCTYMESLALLDQVTDDTATETGAKYVSNASCSIEQTADGYTKHAAEDEATYVSNDVEGCTSK